MASWCYNQDFKEEEQASGSNEKKMILAVEDDTVTLSEDSGEKALTPEDLINKVLMADEGADKVTVVPEVDDKYIATITSYFICLGNTRWEPGAQKACKCRRLLSSKQWSKKHDDTEEEWVPGQKWYCLCYTKYKGGWGQVVEIEESDGTVDYVRAECPSWDLEDSAGSVKELYDKIRSIEPVVNDIVGMDANGCKYIKKYEDFEAMPLFSWKELLTLARVFCKM